MKIKGHFDGRVVVPDEPVPAEWKPNTPVTIEPRQTHAPRSTAAASALLKIAARARDLGFPPDFSEQHDHYIRGTPKR